MQQSCLFLFCTGQSKTFALSLSISPTPTPRWNRRLCDTQFLSAKLACMFIESFTDAFQVLVFFAQDNNQWRETAAHRTRDVLRGKRSNVAWGQSLIFFFSYSSDIDGRVAKRNYSSLVRASYDVWMYEYLKRNWSDQPNDKSSFCRSELQIKRNDESNLLHRSAAHSLHISNRSCSNAKHGWWNWSKSLRDIAQKAILTIERCSLIFRLFVFLQVYDLEQTIRTLSCCNIIAEGGKKSFLDVVIGMTISWLTTKPIESNRRRRE